MDNLELVRALNDYACHCRSEHNFLAAKQSLLQALCLDQTNPLVWSNLGGVHYEIGDLEDADRCIQRALEIDPEFTSACAHKALILSAQYRYDEAHVYFDKAIAKEPDNLIYQWDKSLAYLDNGEWEKGFPLYNVRRKHLSKDYPPYKFPIWTGKEDLNGKGIIIYEEQGSGDKILFSRFIYQLKMKFPESKIYFLCNSLLQPLFWEYQKAKICEILPNGIIFPEDIDYGCWLMGLPEALGCLDVNNVPPDPGFIRQRCDYQKENIKLTTLVPNGKKVGICWQGNKTQALNHQRSVPFEKMIPMIEHPYYSWFNLQVDDFRHDIKKWGMTDLITDCSESILKEGFTRTGVIMLNLDLVITVDTACAHLAGALGVPVWLLATTNNYWIWGNYGKTTPWYPSMTLFRQNKLNDWDEVINNVRKQLDETRSYLTS